MPILLLTLFCIVFTASPAAAQERDDDEPRPLRSGDKIVAKGCLRGSMLEFADAGHEDGEDVRPTGLSFQLKGKKPLLKQLKDRHDGYFVEVTGVLKSNLTDADSRGRQFGPARVIVGADSMTRGGAAMRHEINQPQPVLEVTAFGGTDLSCRR